MAVPLVNSLCKKFCQKGHCVFHQVWSLIISLKNCISLILMQICNKLINNIVVYLYSNCSFEKKKRCPLYRTYTFVFVPRLATCTNIRMPLSLCEWTVFTCVRTFTCLYTLTLMNHSRHLSLLTRVRKPLREWAPQMARRMMQRMTSRICDRYTRRSPRFLPRHSRECINAALHVWDSWHTKH